MNSTHFKTRFCSLSNLQAKPNHTKLETSGPSHCQFTCPRSSVWTFMRVECFLLHLHTGRGANKTGLVWLKVSKFNLQGNYIYKEKVPPKKVFLIKWCLPEKWKGPEGDHRPSLLLLGSILNSFKCRTVQGGIAGGNVRKGNWPSQHLPGVARAAAAGCQGCHVWKDAFCEDPVTMGGKAVAVTSRRLQQCSSVQRSHWCGSWHHIWENRCTVIILPQAFCAWNSRNFSWYWTKNTLFLWNCSPDLKFFYPSSNGKTSRGKYYLESRSMRQPENMAHSSNVYRIQPINLVEEYSPKKRSQENICEMKD